LVYEWVVAILVGLVGGVFDCILAGGFHWPGWKPGDEGRSVYDPGFIGIILTGGAAGWAAWALTTDASFADTAVDVEPVFAAFVAGTAGSEVLSGFVKRKYLEGGSEQTLAALSSSLDREQKLRQELESMRGNS
jgi:hypothetical protein